MCGNMPVATLEYLRETGTGSDSNSTKPKVNEQDFEPMTS